VAVTIPPVPPVPRTRLAPSPTGELHLGNARTFLLTWALARREGWSVVLRIEDLDGPRVREETVAGCLASLEWLGMDWDGPVRRQSEDLRPFRDAMASLAARGLVFRCDLSRKDVRLAASAPHAADGETRYEPSLRPGREAFGFADERANHRLLVEAGPEPVVDELLGPRTFDPGLEAGDLLLWTKAGVPSYQLAVTVDDLAQGVTDVVRGDDLLPSAARQAILHRHLGGTPPRWWHLPLVLDHEGRRLAKRSSDLSLAALRERGVARERVLGFLAFHSGLVPRLEPLDRDRFRDLVDRDTLRALARREAERPLRLPAPDDPEFLPWLTRS
jgi:glutamyl-tRNA synthetase